MSCPAIGRLPAHLRLVLIVAGLFALLGSFVAPAQAGYYGDPYYRSYPCSDRCGYPVYRYNRCSSCGCYRCGYRRSVVYERRYIEREYVERRYSYGGYRRHCGYYGGCYRRYGNYPCGGYGSGGYGRPWGYGYGGVGRRWPAPYVGGGYGAYAEGYDGPPRPPEPVPDAGDDY